MGNNFKRFLSWLMVLTMVLGMMPATVFATEAADDGGEAVVADLDFTDAIGDESGEGWAWANETKTLTLNGVNFTSAVTLPEDSTIVAAEDTVNSIVVEGAAPVAAAGKLTINGSGSLTVEAVNENQYHTVSGAEEIVVENTSLTTYGYAGLNARNVTIRNAKVDIKGYGYGIYSNQTTGSTGVVLENVSGSIVGELDCGIELYVEINSDNSVEDMDNAYVSVLNCQDLTINGELTRETSNSSGHRSGILVYTKDAETNAYAQIENSDIAVNGSTGGINVNSHSDNSAGDDASAAWVTIEDSVVAISTITNTWAAIFVNNNGTGEKATADITIENSNVKALCPNDVGVMTSTKDAASIVTVKNSTLDMSGAYAGIRAKANKSDAADIVVENSVVVVTDGIASNYVGAMDEMDYGISCDVSGSAASSTVIVPVGCEITANSNGTWNIPAGGTVNVNGTEATYAYGAIINADGTITDLAPGAVAQVGEEKYTSLAEAITAANAIEGGATVKLLKNVTLGEKLTISGNVTIEGAYTITRADDYTGTLFAVPAGATLTLDGGLVIDGGNNYTFNKALYESDLAAIKNSGWSAYIVPEENAPVATNPMIVVNGTVNALDVTIQNNLSTGSDNGGKYTVFQVAANATLTTEGAKIKHIATGGANSVAYLASGSEWNIKEGTVIEDTFYGKNGGVCRNDRGTVNMTGGEIKNNAGVNTNGTAFMMYYGTMNMSGGTICGNSSVSGSANGRSAAVYLHSASTLDMSDGSICHNTGTSYGGIDSYHTASMLYISGGFVADNNSVLGNTNKDVNTPGTTSITGGIYGHDVTEYCAENYVAVYNSETGYWTVEYDYVEWIKDELLAGRSVTLERDIVVDGTYIDSIPAATNGNGTYYNPGIFNVVGDVDVTFDLNGHNITYVGHADAAYTATHNASSYNGVVNSCTVAHGLFFANNGAKLTIKGQGNVTVNGMASGVYAASPNSAITVEGGSWANHGCATCGGTNLFLYASHGGEVYIKGGTFAQDLDADGNSYLIVEDGGDKKNEVIDYSLTKIEVTGGTFVGMNPEKAVFIKNGNGNAMSETNVVKEGYEAVQTGENTWTVGEYVEAEVNGVKYGTLAEAVKVANDLGTATVKLLKNVTLGEKLTISGNVTIQGEYTITRADDYTGTLFTVPAGATLTLDGGLTIDGGNNYAFDAELYAADLADWQNPTAAADNAKWFTPEEGAPVATGYMITTSGTVNLNDVTIKNHYSTNGSGIVSASKGAVVTLTGAQITHNASTSGSGLVVNASAGAYSREEELITVTMNEGTVIDGNHVGGNHGVFKVYMGTVFTMNGGEVKNTTGWNSNGVVVGIYHAVFTMNGGTICSNSSVYGPNNGRNAAIYGHSNHLFTMNGGTICHNTGRSKAGIDSPYSETGYTGLTVINGGYVLHNKILGTWTAPDVSGGATMTIYGGTYTQDVDQWCAPGYYARDNGDGTWTVVKGIRVTVTFDDVTMVEGNPVPEFTYTTNFSEVAEDGTMLVVEQPEVTINGAGEYEITANAYVLMNEDYIVTVVPGKLTVKEAVARNGSVYYATLQDAYDDAAHASYIVALKDIVLTETLVCDEAKQVYFKFADGGKYNLSGDLDTLIQVDAGVVYISSGSDIRNTGDVFYVTGGRLTVYGTAKITSEEANCVYVRGGITTIQKAILVSNGEYPAIQGNGNYVGNVSIQGGSVTAPNSDMAIYWPGNGTLSINGGVIKGDTAVYVKSGKLNIKGGEFYGTGDKADFVHNSNGAYATGDAVVIENCKDAAYETPVVSISGGKFVSTNAEPVAVYNCNTENAPIQGFITGGTYNKDVTDDLVAEGYYDLPDAKGEWWNVYPGTITVDDVWYDNWEAAETAVTTDSVIKLYADQTNTAGTSAFDQKGTVTLDLNGHTLSSPYEKTAVNSLPVQKTTLYVVDSTGGGKLIGNDSHSLFAYIDGVVHFNDGVQFIGSLQSTNGKGTFYINGQEILGANGVFQTVNKTARIGMKANGDWAISMGSLTMTADYAALADVNLTVNKSCSIDLNGNDLTVKSLVANGTVIDSTDGQGSITVTDRLWFNNHDNGGYLPVADGENVYRLYATELSNLGARASGANKCQYGFRILFTNVDAYTKLAANLESGMLTAEATWTDGLTGSLADSDTWEWNDANLRGYLEVAASNPKAAITMTLDNSEHISGDEISGYATIATSTGVVISSEAVAYTIP